MVSGQLSTIKQTVKLRIISLRAEKRLTNSRKMADCKRYQADKQVELQAKKKMKKDEKTTTV